MGYEQIVMNSKEMMLGLMLVKDGRLSRDQLKKALLKQGEVRRFGRHQLFGDIIVKLGFLTRAEVDEVLNMQSVLISYHSDHTPLGLLVVEKNFATPAQVYDAIQELQFKDKPLGALLTEKGVITEDQLKTLLAHQEAERTAANSARSALGLPTGVVAGEPIDDFLIVDAGG